LDDLEKCKQPCSVVTLKLRYWEKWIVNMSNKFMKKNVDGDIVLFTDSHAAYVQLKDGVATSRWFPFKKPP